jgi:uncharacterized iron-regulated membrane protein
MDKAQKFLRPATVPPAHCLHYTPHDRDHLINSQLIVAVTGLFLVAGSPFLVLVARLSGAMPDFKVPASIPVRGEKRISADLALEVAQRAIPGMRPVRMGFPCDEEDSFAIQMAPLGSVGVGGQVSIEQYTGKTLAIVDVASLRRIRRFAQIVDEIHTGRLVSIPSEIAVALAALAILHQIGTGLSLFTTRAQ